MFSRLFVKIKRPLEAHMVNVVNIEESLFRFCDEKKLNALNISWKRIIDVNTRNGKQELWML